MYSISNSSASSEIVIFFVLLPLPVSISCSTFLAITDSSLSLPKRAIGADSSGFFTFSSFKISSVISLVISSGNSSVLLKASSFTKL